MADDTTNPTSPTGGVPGSSAQGGEGEGTRTPDAAKTGETRTFTQEDLNRIAAQARAEGEQAGRKKAAEDAERERAAQERARAEAEGKWQDLYAAERKAREEAEARLKQAQEERERGKLETLRATIGAEFKLPPKLIARLTGTTEADIRADAKEMAALLGSAPDLEGGKRGSGAKADPLSDYMTRTYAPPKPEARS